MRKTWWGWLHRALTGIYWFAYAIGVIVAGFGSVDLNTARSNWLIAAATLAKEHGWWVILTVTTVGAVAQEARLRIGSPAIWREVHDLLDQFRDRVFGDNDDPSSLHHHSRVTLFKHVRFCLCWRWWNPKGWRRGIVPWCGWLVPVERSGHTTRKSRVIFRAPDNADEAEGVAGRAWAKNGVVTVSKLPDLSAGASKTKLIRYAKKGFVDVTWLTKRVQRHAVKGDCPSRAICAIPVEVRGKPWGVIVLDSRADKEIRVDAIHEFYGVIGPTLTKLLERA